MKTNKTAVQCYTVTVLTCICAPKLKSIQLNKVAPTTNSRKQNSERMTSPTPELFLDNPLLMGAVHALSGAMGELTEKNKQHTETHQ